MKENATQRLTEFLESQCYDFAIDYSMQESERCSDWVAVNLTNFYDGKNIVTLQFSYDEDNDDLSLLMGGDDSFEVVREFDETIKYFWILVAPYIFPVKRLN